MNSSLQPRKHSLRLWLIPLTVIALLAVTAVAAYAVLLDGDDPDLATTAPDLPTPSLTTVTPTQPPQVTSDSSEAPATDTPNSEEPTEVPPTVAPSDTSPPAGPAVSVFEIDPAQSSSIFVVQTRVLGINSSQSATGGGVTGRFHVTSRGLDPNGLSEFQLDMRSLTTESALLQAFLSSGAFDTEKYPFAEFVAESSSEFPPAYGTGDEFSAELTGILTLNGVSRPVTLQLLARQSGDFFSATADTFIDLSEFDVEVPDTPLGGADDKVHVQVVMVASLA